MMLNWLQNKTVRDVLEAWRKQCQTRGLLPCFMLCFPADVEEGNPEFFTLPQIDLRKMLPDELEKIAADLRAGTFRTWLSSTGPEEP